MYWYACILKWQSTTVHLDFAQPVSGLNNFILSGFVFLLYQFRSFVPLEIDRGPLIRNLKLNPGRTDVPGE